MNKAKSLLVRLAGGSFLFLTSAATWFLLLSLSGAACLIRAAYLFCGESAALAIAGVLCIVGATLIRRGAING